MYLQFSKHLTYRNIKKKKRNESTLNNSIKLFLYQMHCKMEHKTFNEFLIQHYKISLSIFSSPVNIMKHLAK